MLNPKGSRAATSLPLAEQEPKAFNAKDAEKFRKGRKEMQK
jgi:hypothetical protein